ncbi:GntR family transcriptional regulator [Rubrobacter aplysinae]|uniref:GntR family transcriptional regulator n=1 Tax=Rubrobacter aplysinae TaxID=909625 RepID=UPI00128B90B7|nr:GntR family transcriptional regulator [Rubrobacter aplysinae]
MEPAEPQGAFKKPQTAQHAVLAEIRGMIMSRELKPGERLRPGEISERLEVSRLPIREALKVLEAEGQLTYQPHHGYRVTKFSMSELSEIYRMRQLLESEMLRSTASQVDESLIERLEDLIQEMDEISESENLLRFTEVNREFHMALLEYAGMPQFMRVVKTLWQVSDSYRSLFFNKPASRRRVQEEHRRIVEACKAREAEALVSAMNEHRSNAIVDMAVVIGDGGS